MMSISQEARFKAMEITELTLHSKRKINVGSIYLLTICIFVNG